MTVRERAGAWLLLFVGLLLLLWLFQPVLLPFVAGLAIAYFLDPIADRLEALGLGRGMSAAVTLLAFAVLAVAMLLLLAPLISSQITGLSARLPGMIEALQRTLVAGLDYLQGSLDPDEMAKLRSTLGGEIGKGVSVVTGLVKGVFARGVAFFEFLSLLVVTPVVAFYLLRDWDRIVAEIDALLPREHRETIRTQAGHVNEMLSGFVRGQASVCLILGLGYGLALAAAGLPFGFTVGMMAGIVAFVPYLGAVFGLVTSVGLALLEFDDPTRIGIVIAIFVAGQVVESYLLTPKLVGERVRLHPVWVIFALFAGGSLMGFVGMLIALPVAATVGVGVRFAVSQYKTSRLYDQEPLP